MMDGRGSVVVWLSVGLFEVGGVWMMSSGLWSSFAIFF